MVGEEKEITQASPSSEENGLRSRGLDQVIGGACVWAAASPRGALTRQGGGYNGKAVSKSSCSREFLLAWCSSCSWGRWDQKGQAAVLKLGPQRSRPL